MSAGLKLIFFFCLIFVQVCVSHAQPSTGSYKADFELLTSALLTTHPNLYRSTSGARFKDVLDSLNQHLDKEVSALDFFRMSSLVIAMIREGHSNIRPSKNLIAEIQQQALFPFDVWLMDDRLVIRQTRDQQYTDLVGAEITHINEQPVTDILNLMGRAIPSNSGKNNGQALKASLSLYYNFAQAYYYYVDTTSAFLLGYQKEGSTTKTVRVNGIRGAINGDDYLKLPGERDVPVITKLNQKEDYAVIKITTFAWWTGSYSIKAYEKVIKGFFKKVEEQEISHLIIDVRNNRGGEELIGLDLLSYIIPYSFRPYDAIKSSAIDFSHLANLPDFQGQLKFKSNDFESADDGYSKKTDPILQTIDPKTKHTFRGKVYVLGNGRSWSAASTFLTWTKSHGVGTFIGQEGGGAFDIVDGRYMVRFTLPFSGLHINYPVWSMVLNAKNGDPTRGAMPDIVTERTSAQLLNGTDTEMVYVLQQIRANTKNQP